MVIQWRSLQNTGPKLARLLSGRFFLSGGNGHDRLEKRLQALEEKAGLPTSKDES